MFAWQIIDDVVAYIYTKNVNWWLMEKNDNTKKKKTQKWKTYKKANS